MEKTWEQMIKEEVAATTGLTWITNTFSAYVMVFPDGSWLFLDEDLLWLRPGISQREEMVWSKGTTFDSILPYLK
jgi:hypothetical protein